MTRSNKNKKIVAVSVENDQVVDVADANTTDYQQIKNQMESTQDPLEQVVVKQNVDPVEASSSVAVGAEPDVKPKKSRAKKAKAVIEADLDKGIVVDEPPVEPPVETKAEPDVKPKAKAKSRSRAKSVEVKTEPLPVEQPVSAEADVK